MHILTIIPARGGSKGLPGKNIRPLLGKPMLAYSIEHAKVVSGDHRITVSTDSDEIARVAQVYGAEVVPRPAQISGDTASSESALVHTLDFLHERDGYDPELIVFLQATSPVRRADDVARAVAQLRADDNDSLLSVSPMHGFLWRREAGAVRSFSYDHRSRQRRQDAPEDFVENGSIYVFKPWVLREYNNRLGGKISLYEMPAWCAPQVDDVDDLRLIEAILASGLIPAGAAADFSAVRLLVLDFDGVMTDNSAWIDQDGRESVQVHRGDGMGIGRLRTAGKAVMVLSKETNPVVAARCRKLGIPCIQGEDDKLTALKQVAAERGLTPEQIAYVGNDVNDLACMGWVGLPVAVQDALTEVKNAARWVTTARGGRGAVREVAEAWLNTGGFSS